MNAIFADENRPKETSRMKKYPLIPLFSTLLIFSVGIGPVYSQDDMSDVFGGFGDEEPATNDESAPAEGGTPAADNDDGDAPSQSFEAGDDNDVEIPEMQDMTEEERSEEAAKVAEQERVRLEARRQQVRRRINDAMSAMENGRWQVAVDLVEEAEGLLDTTNEMDDEIRIAKETKSEAYFQMARTLYERRKQGSNLEQAKQFLSDAEEAWEGNEKVDMLLADINEYQQKVDDGKIPQPIDEEPKYETREQNVKRLLVRGRKELDIGDYDQAEKTFQEVLRYDRYNKDALRFLTRVAEKQQEAKKVERDMSIAKMMKDSEEAWLYPLDVDDVGAQQDFEPADGDVMVEEDAIARKLREIPVRQINFRRAHISDVISELVRISREMDPDGIGVNIIFMDPELADGGGDVQDDDGNNEDADPFGFGGGDGGGNDGGGASRSPIKPITLQLRDVTLLDALKTVTEISDLYYRFDGNVVIIQRKGEGQMITRFYPVDPARWTQVTDTLSGDGNGGGGGGGDPFGDPFGGGGGGGGGGASDGPDLNELFERYGVDVPDNGGIAYEPLIAQLVVTLTPDEFPQFEQVLGKINVAPSQVQIEARFVEVNQQELEELGVEWIFTDDAELLVKDGPGPVAGRERIQADAMPTGVTGGLRFFDFDSTARSTEVRSRTSSPEGNQFLGDVLSLRGVLTNPELQMIVHALEQQGNSDLLSAPRVTTINGVNAIIEVVEEIIYPTEFDVTENEIDVVIAESSDGSGGIPFVPPTVIPGGFETRDVGVILNVTPTVGADNYTINLVMLPEIAELVDWIQYGSQVPVGEETFNINMPQPVFASRNITTSMIVWDGHTVVMGGLIREQLTTFEDKVPLLGDIPLLGRLFRSEGTRSQKRNLMIFVTARLVDPAGNNVNQGDRQDLLSD